MHVEDIGVSEHNRSISWKHVHYVQWQIDNSEGFTRLRYKEATVLSPNPADSEGVWRHTRRITDAAGGRLAPPTRRVLHGALTKNHLILGLICRLHGGIAYENDGSVMKIPPNSPGTMELVDTVANGIFVEVIAYGAVEADPDGVQYLSTADNLDQVKALPEHEAELLWNVWRQSQELTAPPGKTQFEVVLADMQLRTAGSWGQEDIVWVYNFARTMAPSHMECIRLFHFFHVNATLLRIDVSFFGTLAEHVPLQFPWCRVALLVSQYMTDLSKNGASRKVGGKILAQGLTNDKVRKLGQDVERLSACEDLLRHYFNSTFAGHGEASSDPPPCVIAAAGTVLTKMGELLCSPVDLSLEKGQKALAKIEHYFRKQLPTNDAVPDVMLESTRALLRAQDEETQATKKSRPGPSTTPSLAPQVAFGADGDVQESFASRAAASGLAQGVRVRLVKATQSRPVGVGGLIVSLPPGGPCKVKFDADSAELSVKLGCLQAEAARSLSRTAAAASVDEAAASVDEGGEDVGEWKLFEDADLDHSLRCILSQALFQLNAGYGSDASSLAVSTTGVVKTKKAMPARSVRLFPWTTDVIHDDRKSAAASKGRDATSADREYVTAHLAMAKSAESAWRLLEPQGVHFAESPLWMVVKAPLAAGSSTNMEWHEVVVTANSSCSSKDPAFKDGMKGAPVQVRVPYLANRDYLAAGTVLVGGKSKKRKAA